MIFFAIILAISAVVSGTSMSKPNIKHQKTSYQKLTIQRNPYKVPSVKKEIKDDSQGIVPEIVKYCRYCGAKKDLDAIFCHMCGSKF